jgi:PEP-CTERM motif
MLNKENQMKRLYARIAIMALCVAMPNMASAAAMISVSPPQADGSISGTFEHQGIAGGLFNDLLTFNFSQFGTANATISSVFLISQNNNVDFTSVTFNGTSFDVSSQGQVEFRFLQGLAVLPGLQTLGISGTSGGNGSYAGTFSVATLAAIPEPATWALLLIGFGAVGSSLRRRRYAKSVTC